MQRTRTPGARALALTTALALTGCASTTIIRSDPTGAKVFIEGSRVGVTPYRHSDSRPSFSNLIVRLEKEGYEPFETVITRNESVVPGAVVGALFFFVPALWVLGYDDQRLYELKPSRGVPSRDWERDVSPEQPEEY